MADEQSNDQLSRFQRYLDGEGRKPGFYDVLDEIFGNPDKRKVGMLERIDANEDAIEAVKTSVGTVDSKVTRILDRATWLLIGLGANLATKLPEALSWIRGLMP